MYAYGWAVRGQEAGLVLVPDETAWAFFRAPDLGGNVVGLLLADNYNRATTANHKGTKAQRTLKRIRDGPLALRFLRAAGSRAGPAAARLWQPLAGLARGRLGAEPGQPHKRGRVPGAFDLMSAMPKGAGSGRSDFSWSKQTLNALLDGNRSSTHQRLMNHLGY